jgi:ATP synthase F1 epsilon subunit
MIRRFASRIAAPTAASSAFLAMRGVRQLPQGFDYLTNKVKELDVSAPYEAATGMTVNVTRHDEILFAKDGVKAVTVAAAEGEMGIQPGHEYEIAKLNPGVIAVEVADGQQVKFFTSGGFAHVNPAGSVDINCAEAIPLEDLDADLASKELLSAQDALKNAKTDKEKAVFEIQVEVLEGVVSALKGAAQH